MKFTETHEWVDVEDGVGTIGVTEYAQGQLGDIVYVELPKIGKEVIAGDEAVVIESTKAATDIYTPVSGRIVAVNEALIDAVELVNNSAEKEGWLFKIELSDLDELTHLHDTPTDQ